MSPILGIYASSISPSLNATSYESISTVTVGSGGQSTITFSSIPSTYKHLQLRCSIQQVRSTYGISDGWIQFNSDTSTNYSWHELYGDGSTASAAQTGVSASFAEVSDGMWGTNTGGTFGISIIDILDYANTSKYKTVRALSGVDINGTLAGYGGRVGMMSSNWRSTSAISSITFTGGQGNFTQYSKFALYGIK